MYGMKNITTEEVVDKLKIFKAIFVKLDEFVWWDMEITKTDAGTQFTSEDFQESIYVHGV